MRAKTIIVAVAAVAAAVLSFSAAAAAPPPGRGTPKLVRIHVFEPAGPKLDANGKPAKSVANCSPDNPTKYLTTPAYTGWKSTLRDRVAHYNAATTPAGIAAPVADLQASLNAWSVTAAPNAPDFTVTTAGPVVTKPTANRRTDLMFGRASGNALAITYTWRWSDTGEYESDTIFNKAFAWAEISTAGIGADGCNESVAKYDLQNIATHEFGHTYGLDHPPNDRFATMYAYGYSGETLKRSPATSDTNGIRVLYP